MRKMYILAACFLLLTAVAARAEVKTAVFDVNKVALECAAYKEAERIMKTDFDSRKASLDAEKNALAGKVAAARAPGATTALRDEVLKFGEEYNRKNVEFLGEYEKAYRRIRSDIDVLIREAAAQYAKEKGYNLILDVMLVRHSALPDITSDMLTKTDALWRSMRQP